ncbi:hypothetical protein DNTS_024187 [Danionella cerebrum]|uniref:Uncharacterized protein n=1 Tax=Danionella cerebrum TaxID=2873325 RepID=A0A553RIM0_9TELE|nr:hypothetical protein DNTS_024187 [Danionella translucida]
MHKITGMECLLSQKRPVMDLLSNLQTLTRPRGRWPLCVWRRDFIDRTLPAAPRTTKPVPSTNTPKIKLSVTSSPHSTDPRLKSAHEAWNSWIFGRRSGLRVG